jgi:hypothetical protein
MLLARLSSPCSHCCPSIVLWLSMPLCAGVRCFAVFIPVCSTAVTQHTTAYCSMQVIDIKLSEHLSASITSLRVVQQKHCGAKYKHSLINTNQSRADEEMLPKQNILVLSVITTKRSKIQIIKHLRNSTAYNMPITARFLDLESKTTS